MKMWTAGYRVLEVPGDGSCGLHSAVLLLEGSIASQEKITTIRAMMANFMVDAAIECPQLVLAYFAMEGLPSGTGVHGVVLDFLEVPDSDEDTMRIPAFFDAGRLGPFLAAAAAR
jgi:hypothetical protein